MITATLDESLPHPVMDYGPEILKFHLDQFGTLLDGLDAQRSKLAPTSLTRLAHFRVLQDRMHQMWAYLHQWRLETESGEERISDELREAIATDVYGGETSTGVLLYELSSALWENLSRKAETPAQIEKRNAALAVLSGAYQAFHSIYSHFLHYYDATPQRTAMAEKGEGRNRPVEEKNQVAAAG